MTFQPKISVLINNYNYASFLGAAIDSALAQTYPDVEVVVVDDGSTDGSRSVIAGYGDRIVPVLKANGGQASSFNAGFQAASGELLFLLDADDCLLPGKLGHVANLYAENQLDWCFDKVTTDPRQAPALEIAATIVDKRDAMAHGLFPSLPVPTSGLSFHRTLLARILPMPTAGDVVLSDNYLKFAAAFLGRGAVVETPLTFQRIHAQNRYTGTDRMQSLKPKIMMATGTALRQRYPGLRRLGISLAAGGLADSGLYGRALAQTIQEQTATDPTPKRTAMEIHAHVWAKRIVRKLRPSKQGSGS